jgi:hypothetical protein
MSGRASSTLLTFWNPKLDNVRRVCHLSAMSDGDIWGSGRLSSKWLAARSQREVDLAHGRGVSRELSDLTARAVADTLRHADRRPCETAVELLVEMRNADVVAWIDAVQRLDNQWGSRDAEIACRAAIAARARLDEGADAEKVRLTYFETYSEQVCAHLEDAINAQISCEGATSAFLPEHARHFALQLAKGSDVKIIAPRRKAAPKTTRDILDMDVL